MNTRFCTAGGPLGSRAVFRFAVVDAENAESLGVVVFVRPDFKPGDTIPQ
jgi:hypothetical protein